MQAGREYPPPLMTSEPGSFARKTIVERKPQILREVSRAYDYPAAVRAGLAAFAAEIASQAIRPLTEDAPDVALWNGAWAAHEGCTWLQVPWYFAEAFFYRRLLEILGYYQPGPWHGVDPFAPQKADDLERALPAYTAILGRPEPDVRAAFTEAVYDALWGNRADLSNRTIAATAQEGLRGRQADRLLIDDTPHMWHDLCPRVARVDIVTDNSGLELALDLRLVDLLLRHELTREVRIHLKRMPFFVSDAMVRDLEHTLERLSETSAGAPLAARLRAAIEAGRLTLRDDPFWSTCLSYHPLPDPIRAELAASDLVLFKGDVNYRRLLDDRHWPHTAHLAEIAAHMPSPYAALRTLKGELIVDLAPGQAEMLAAQDASWMINGQRGVVQYVRRPDRDA